MEEVERKTKEHGKGGQAGCKWVVNVLLPFKVLEELRFMLNRLLLRYALTR